MTDWPCRCGSRMAHVECVCGGDDGWYPPKPAAALPLENEQLNPAYPYDHPED